VEHGGAHGSETLTYWYDDRNLKVFTIDGCVFVSSLLQFAVWPDWQAMTNTDARKLAQAIWAAAAHNERRSG
jgi:hypothetical protein